VLGRADVLAAMLTTARSPSARITKNLIAAPSLVLAETPHKARRSRNVAPLATA
jgi:hypothetical protein